MKNAEFDLRFSGHVHFLGTVIILAAAVALYVIWGWNEKLTQIGQKTAIIEHKIESLETKIKLLELQNEVRQAEIIKPTPALH